jgi:UDP:flavonoid glycosyltransferase YjiC (YdhE family)
MNPPLDLPEGIFMLKTAPHSWLFPRMAAVVHHGCAGTAAKVIIDNVTQTRASEK